MQTNRGFVYRKGLNTRCCNPVLSEGFSIARVHQQGELHVLLLNKEIKKDENVARIDRMGRS